MIWKESNMSLKNNISGLRRYSAIASREIVPALRLASVCAVVCGIAILLSQLYVKQKDGLDTVSDIPFYLFVSYIVIGIGIGIATFSYLAEREVDRFYKLFPISPLGLVLLKTVITLLFCAAFISVTVYSVYEICDFVTPESNYGYIKGYTAVRGGEYGLMELPGTLYAFFYGFSVGAFCSSVFSRVIVAVIHIIPFLATKLLIFLPAILWFEYRVGYVSKVTEISFTGFITPELGLLAAGVAKDNRYRLEWFENALWINGVIILLLAFILISLRRGEHSGKLFADSAFYPVYALPISFGTVIALEYFLGSYQNISKWSASDAIRYAAVSTLLFVLIGVICEKNIKRWGRVLAVGGIAFFVTFTYYVFIIEFDDLALKIVSALAK